MKQPEQPARHHSGSLNRREFLGVAAGTLVLAAIPSNVLGANDRVRIAA